MLQNISKNSPDWHFLILREEEIKIHGLGAAINRAVNIALQLQLRAKGSLKVCPVSLKLHFTPSWLTANPLQAYETKLLCYFSILKLFLGVCLEIKKQYKNDHIPSNLLLVFFQKLFYGKLCEWKIWIKEMQLVIVL